MKLFQVFLIFTLLTIPFAMQLTAISEEQFKKAQAIVSDAEEYRGYPNRDFLYKMEVADTLNDKLRSSTQLNVFVQNKDGERKSITKITGGDSKGQVLLQSGVNMWFYKPGTSRAFRISSAQRLLGGASYADVSSTNYSKYYKPTAISEQTIGSTPAYVISLEKTLNGVAYANIEFFIAKDGNRPIKSEFYTPSKKLLKSMYFRNYSKIGNKEFSLEWVVVDALQKNAVTYIRIQDVKFSKLPESTFSVAGIKKF